MSTLSNQVEMSARSLLRQSICPQCTRAGYDPRDTCEWCKERAALCDSLLRGAAVEPSMLLSESECAEIISDLEAKEWQGLMPDDIRSLAETIDAHRRATVPPRADIEALLESFVWAVRRDNDNGDQYTRQEVKDLRAELLAAIRAVQPPEPAHLTDWHCDEIITALEAYEFTGFSRDDIRLIAGRIDTYRTMQPALTKSG
jgi:hypothetical protein